MYRQVHVQRRRAGWWPAALLLIVICLLPVPALEAVPHAAGRPAFARMVWPGFNFGLTFTHSIFGVPVREAFTIDWRGRLVLREIWSTDQRIIGYYDIEGAETRVRPGDVRIIDLRLAHRKLTIRATPIGGRAYDDGRCRFALTTAAGDWGSLDLGVRWRPLALQLWNWGERGCPQSLKTP